MAAWDPKGEHGSTACMFIVKGIEMKTRSKEMKLAVVAALFAMTALSTGVEAKGCLKGAAVGGLGGHVAGKHGLVGAAVGCAVGHHMAKKKDQQNAQAGHAPIATAPDTSPQQPSRRQPGYTGKTI